MTSSSYFFGHTDIAAERLRLVAELFAPEMRQFLHSSAPEHPKVAVDLGCGPGYTTRILGEVVRPETLIGVDISERFLQMAMGEANSTTQFVLHDLTTSPLPFTSADILFVHLLLTHLPDPGPAMTIWAQGLAAGGLILVDEVESINTDHPILREYLSLVEHTIAGRGGELYIGPTIATISALPGLRIRSSNVVRHPVGISDAAGMFSMNLETLRKDPSVRSAYDGRALERMAHALGELRESSTPANVTWSMRQVVFERA